MRIPYFWTDLDAACWRIPTLRLFALQKLLIIPISLVVVLSLRHVITSPPWRVAASSGAWLLLAVCNAAHARSVCRTVRQHGGLACTTCLYPYPEHADPDKPCLCPECGSQLAPADARRAWLHANVWP